VIGILMKNEHKVPTKFCTYATLCENSNSMQTFIINSPNELNFYGKIKNSKFQLNICFWLSHHHDELPPCFKSRNSMYQCRSTQRLVKHSHTQTSGIQQKNTPEKHNT
jgi:hypothetical protein